MAPVSGGKAVLGRKMKEQLPPDMTILHRLLALAVLSVLVPQAAAATYYVDAANGVDGRGRGGSWGTAFASIQAAVDAAKSGSTILVTNGVYAPFVSGNKKLAIRSVEGAGATAIEGVRGSEAPCAELGRWGDQKIYDTNDAGKRFWTGDWESVFRGGTSTSLAGFTLRNAANGAWGGTLSHCVLSNLTQNAVWMSSLSDSLVTGNANDVYYATDGAGAMLRKSTLNRCRIVGNRFVQGAWDCTLLDCLLADNRQTWETVQDWEWESYGGNLAQGGTLCNCTVAGNVLKEQEQFHLIRQKDGTWVFESLGTYVFGAAVSAASCLNCIVWSNRTDRTDAPADFADMDGVAIRTTESAADPLFRNPAGGDWRLLPWSPCRDAGADYTKKTGKFDLDGRPRKAGGAVDLGAFEHPQGVPVQGDWDGDGIADPATYCAATFEWCVLESGSGEVLVAAFGETGAVPVPADWDGDGRLEPGYYTAAAARPAFVRPGPGGEVVRTELGAKASTPLVLRDAGADEPVLAAWSGTSKKPALSFSDGRPDIVFGTKGAKALAADFDGDGSSDPAFYTAGASRPAFSVLSTVNGLSTKALFPKGAAVPLGDKGSTPCVADYDGDGMVDFGAFSGSAKAPVLQRLLSSSRWREKRSLPFGAKGSLPVPGDWDGDGCADPAVFQGALWSWIDSGWDLVSFLF